MPLILATRPNVYSASPLDRAAERREDAEWVAERLADPETLFVPVWRSRNLVAGLDEKRPEAVYVSGKAAAALRMAGGPWVFLGMLGTQAVFALDISAADDPVPLLPAELGRFTDLRAVGWGEPRPEAAVLAHARGLMHWRARHRFCGVCGAVCEPRSSGHMVLCTACEAQHFPRTDPAVIMLGYYGEALTKDIVVDRTELIDVRWFSREQLSDPDRHGFMLPRGDSIARRLVDDWLAAV